MKLILTLAALLALCCAIQAQTNNRPCSAQAAAMQPKKPTLEERVERLEERVSELEKVLEETE